MNKKIGYAVFMLVLVTFSGVMLYSKTKDISDESEMTDTSLANGDVGQSNGPDVLSPDPVCATDPSYYVDKSGNSLSEIEEIKNDINSNRCYLKDNGDGYYSSYFQSNGEYVFGFTHSENGDLTDNITLESGGEVILPDGESDITDSDAVLLFKTDSSDFKISVGDKDVTNIRSSDFE